MKHITMHGPFWQPECEACHWMGDCWDSPQEAADDAAAHDCFAALIAERERITKQIQALEGR